MRRKILHHLGMELPHRYGWVPESQQWPVTGVTWFDAEACCAWKGGRLPAEAEWQRSAEGLDRRKYPWGNEKPDPGRANYDKTKVGYPTPVGLFPRGATPEGAHDLAGNVWE
ncbi:MAG: SUMF1/EgtB/PvdO family nonheme iron enzyme [Acidobacteria bacterium]|nr:SUMF1/EgtB/PvdO family nonheme iron enzyme [Acidobacteriota bacterium]